MTAHSRRQMKKDKIFCDIFFSLLSFFDLSSFSCSFCTCNLFFFFSWLVSRVSSIFSLFLRRLMSLLFSHCYEGFVYLLIHSLWFHIVLLFRVLFMLRTNFWLQLTGRCPWARFLWKHTEEDEICISNKVESWHLKKIKIVVSVHVFLSVAKIVGSTMAQIFSKH